MVSFGVVALVSLIVLFVFVCLLVAKDEEERERDDYEQLKYIEKWNKEHKK